MKDKGLISSYEAKTVSTKPKELARLLGLAILE